ncbi:UNVERIFIED_CONTAM: Arabinogalactan protein 20 [Sesamum indicum]
MEMIGRALAAIVVVVLAAAVAFPSVAASSDVKSFAPAPSPLATSDGTAIDQGIAYVLMLLALVLTYIIH